MECGLQIYQKKKKRNTILYMSLSLNWIIYFSIFRERLVDAISYVQFENKIALRQNSWVH